MYFSQSEIDRKRVAQWFIQAKPINIAPNWTERRLAIDIGEHTYIVTDGQIFQCAHCGHHDPEWTAAVVLAWVKEVFSVEPYEINIVCSIAEVVE